jgi:branched-chain amino acid transport system ATP-binding protein
MSAPLLKVENLDLFYGDAQALAGVSLEIAPGEIVAIVGANGAGKSSLIRSIHGIEKPARGQVRFDGSDITGWPSWRVCEAGIGHVAEGRQVFPNLSVLENLEMGATPKRARALEKQTLERVFAMFPRLAERRRQSAGTLSGGEQQMVAIGRALMSQPTALLLDEPSLGLSPLMTGELFKALATIRSGDVSVLLVEQNARKSLAIADRGYLLEIGQVAGEGSARALMDDPAVQRAYLGL